MTDADFASRTDIESSAEPDAVPPAVGEQLAAVAVALVVGAGLTVLARIGPAALVLGLAGAQALLVLAWVIGTGLPGRIGGLVLGALAAAAADLVVVVWPNSELSPLLAVVGLSVPAMFVHQLTRGVVRQRVTESLSDIALLVACVIAGAALIPLRHETAGERMTTTVLGVATVALVVSLLVDTWWPVPRFDARAPRGLTAVAAATVAGALVGFFRLRNTVEFSSGRALFLGAAVAAVVSLLGVGTGFLSRDVAVRWLRPGYVALIPLLLSAPVSYLLCLAVRA